MGGYYFASALLPPVHLGQQPELSFHELMDLYEANLSPADWAQVVVVRSFFDIYNLCSFWRDEPFDSHGNLSRQQLEEALSFGVYLPAYALDFLDTYLTDQERIRHFGGLITGYFQENIRKSKGFLHRWLSFEREWRLLVVALRAGAMRRDLRQELQYEDPLEDFAALLLAQVDSPSLDLPERYEPIKEIYEELRHDPRQLEAALEHYRFDQVDAMAEEELFSIGALLAYMVQLIIAERWLRKELGAGTSHKEFPL